MLLKLKEMDFGSLRGEEIKGNTTNIKKYKVQTIALIFVHMNTYNQTFKFL